MAEGGLGPSNRFLTSCLVKVVPCGIVSLFRIAMVSFSNFGSSTNEGAGKVREAVAYLHKNHPDLIVDGEIQADFALNQEMLEKKFPFSKFILFKKSMIPDISEIPIFSIKTFLMMSNIVF